MDASALYALRDPLGVPAAPIIFLILGVLTWALHIAAVHILLGASGLTLTGALSKNPHWRRLADAMIGTAKVALSVAIVLGVAPLLFVQVVYDPFWYTSNVLSAWWVIGFIVFLIIGSLALFIFYGLNQSMKSGAKTRCPGSLIAAIAFFLVVGFIMHALSVQMLHPEKWMAWYAPGGIIDASGRSLHEYNFWRFGFFISLSVPVIGLWMIAYRRYIMGRTQEDSGYLDFLRSLSMKLIPIGGVISLVLLAGWMMTLPANVAGFATGIWPASTAAILLLAVALPFVLAKKLDQGYWGFAPFAFGAVALIVVAVMREMLRWITLFGVHGYNALDYKLHMDWYSTLMFFLTFGVIGGGVLAYLLTVAWKAGQTKGVYTASPMVNRMGTLGISLLGIWIIQYFVIGLWVAYAG
ncbi:MAG: hypothetical protein B7X12_08730 [Halothiobacillus sp. 20-53-49]|nr:hypothetical protein [Halothiobacillaceae bacterium]OYV45463.1 MAG: hypothetical protein B7X12_08730 [Halothiobacillus sp. 20-53-49]HUM99861.1 hypothetical protein [Halothiobacillus sp.]